MSDGTPTDTKAASSKTMLRDLGTNLTVAIVQPQEVASAGNGRFRRVSPVAVRPGEGLLTEPTPAVRPWSRERVFMPLSRRLFGGVVDEI